MDVSRLANRLLAEISSLYTADEGSPVGGEKISSGPAGFLESPYGHDAREVPGYLDALAVRAAVAALGPLDTSDVQPAHAALLSLTSPR
jgi:hypothetical protein